MATKKVVELAVRTRAKHRGGRPRACDARVRAIVLDVARTGAHRCVMAALAGISLRTLNRFLQLCENALEKMENGCRLTKEEEEFCQFCLDFHKSEVAAEIALLEVALNGAKANPRTALAFLERRWPERWARRRLVPLITLDEGEWPGDTGESRPKHRARASKGSDGQGVDSLTRELIEAELARRGVPNLTTGADRETQDEQQ